jgi:hypothetical protein
VHLKRTREGTGEGTSREAALEATEPLVVDILDRAKRVRASGWPAGVLGMDEPGRCGSCMPLRSSVGAVFPELGGLSCVDSSLS